MRWSKAWFVVVALLAALGMSLAVVVPYLVQRDLDRNVARRLASSAAGAESVVQLHARRWIDAAGHAALDDQLAEALDHASTGSANLDLLHATAQERLRAFQREWKAYQTLAIDAHGRVMARAGAQEDRWKDDVAAAQVVVEALKGFRLDDTWLEDGRLLKVVAAPVVLRDRYAGAVLVVLDLAADLAQPLADRLGTAVVFAAAGKVVGASAGAPPVEGALAELGKRQASVDAEPVTVGAGTGTGGVMALSRAIPGSAAPGAQVIVLAEVPRVASLSALQAHLLAPSAQVPWMQLVPVLLVVLATLLFGLFLVGREHAAPLDRLQRVVQSVARGDTPRVDESGLKDGYRAVARSVNAIVERLRGAPRMPSSIDIPAIGRTPATGTPTIPLPSEPATGPDLLGSHTPLPPPAPAAASSSSSLTASLSPQSPPVRPLPPLIQSDSPFVAPSPIGFGPPSSAPGPSPLPPLEYTGPGATPAHPFDPGALPGSMPGAGSAAGLGVGSGSAPPFSPPSSPPFGPGQGPGRSPPPMASFAPAKPSWSPSPPAGLGGFSPPGLGSLDEAPAVQAVGEGRLDPGLAALGPAPMVAPPPEGFEAEWPAVFQDFVDTRQRCGESVDGITYERFASKLRGNREQLMTRFGCKGVKFQVYVKDGKAALKATPIN